MNQVARNIIVPELPSASPMEVQRIRESLGMTQLELGQSLGVGEYSVYRWEAGTRNITPSHTKLLRKLYQEHLTSLRTA